MVNFLNIGVIGLGEQSWDNLLPSLANIKNANIAAVCDINDTRLEAPMRNYGAKGYKDYSEMLARENLDALVVASYPAVHEAVLREALPRHIPTFIEKPPTLTTGALLDIITLNKEKVITAVGLNFGFADPVQSIKSIMGKPEFGDLQYVRACHYSNKPKDPLWGLPSGCRSFLLAQAIHPIGLLSEFGTFSDQPNIYVDGNNKGMIFRVAQNAIDKKGHVFAMELVTCSVAPFFEWQLEVIGSGGVIIKVNSLWEIEVYSQHSNRTLLDSSKWWRDTWHPSPVSGGYRRSGYTNQLEMFFETITNPGGNTDNIRTLEDMLPIYKLMDAMENTYSARSNFRE